MGQKWTILFGGRSQIHLRETNVSFYTPPCVNFFEIDSDTNRHSLLPSSDSSRLHPLHDIDTMLYTTKDNPQTFCFSVSKWIVCFLYCFVVDYYSCLYSDFLLWTPYLGCRCLHRCFPHQCLKNSSLESEQPRTEAELHRHSTEQGIFHSSPCQARLKCFCHCLANHTSALTLSTSSGCRSGHRWAFVTLLLPDIFLVLGF